MAREGEGRVPEGIGKAYPGTRRDNLLGNPQTGIVNKMARWKPQPLQALSPGPEVAARRLVHVPPKSQRGFNSVACLPSCTQFPRWKKWAPVGATGEHKLAANGDGRRSDGRHSLAGPSGGSPVRRDEEPVVLQLVGLRGRREGISYAWFSLCSSWEVTRTV